MSRVSCRSSAKNAIAIFRSPRSDGASAEKGSLQSPEFENFERDDFRRLRRQGEEGEEIAAARRVRSESAFQAPEGVFVVGQSDHDALRRGMLALAEPCIPA